MKQHRIEWHLFSLKLFDAHLMDWSFCTGDTKVTINRRTILYTIIYFIKVIQLTIYLRNWVIKLSSKCLIQLKGFQLFEILELDWSWQTTQTLLHLQLLDRTGFLIDFRNKKFWNLLADDECSCFVIMKKIVLKLTMKEIVLKFYSNTVHDFTIYAKKADPW